MCDFSASWFSRFVAPECVQNGEKGERLQISCNRDTFLQSFNIIDDTELEFIVEIRGQDEGQLKIMKTRDICMVEATMSFRIDSEIICDEMYIFPENQLQIKGNLGYFRPVKDIFRQNAKSEIMCMEFTQDRLVFSGQ